MSFKIFYSGNKASLIVYRKGEYPLHRKDGPAWENSRGDKLYYLDGLLHRTDGPAIHLVNGTKQWWLFGKRIDEIEYNKLYKKTWY